MSSVNIVLFDVDGVLAIPTEPFALTYARERGLPNEPFTDFFKNAFPAARIGKADLKELISTYASTWKWHGSPEELLEKWFDTENIRNEPLIEYIQQLRIKGILCYVATNQEKYRGRYVREVMFKNEFDGFFISAEMGLEKPDSDFFKCILESLTVNCPRLRPEQIVFIDDIVENTNSAAAAGMKSITYRQATDVIGELGEIVSVDKLV